MRKILIGMVIGVVLGGAVAWWFSHKDNPEPAEAPRTETPASPAGLHLTREQQAAEGLIVANPEPAEIPIEAVAIGRVLDPTPLASLVAEIEAADAVAAASAKEWERARTLGENAAARTLETAEAAMKRDRALAESARSRLIGGWGKELAERSDLSQLTHSLLLREVALARVDVAMVESLNGNPSAVRVRPLAGEATSSPAELIGPAPNTDPQLQGRGFLILIRQNPVAPGTALSVRLGMAGKVQKGFRLPRTAVVQHGGGTFLFVQTGDQTFERKIVEIGSEEGDRVFVKSGVTSQDRVVMTGAQQLLSEEFKGAAAAE